jgi:hypothetical protein
MLEVLGTLGTLCFAAALEVRIPAAPSVPSTPSNSQHSQPLYAATNARQIVFFLQNKSVHRILGAVFRRYKIACILGML